jgi:hypothetical protein
MTELGATLEVSPIGFGTMGPSGAYGEITPVEAEAVVGKTLAGPVSITSALIHRY